MSGGNQGIEVDIKKLVRHIPIGIQCITKS
jgi:hypothetical protein